MFGFGFSGPGLAPSALTAPRGVLMAVYGDSRCRNSHSADGLQLQANGFAFWTEALSRGRVRVPGRLNFGVSGQTTEGVLARIGDVIASDAAIVCVLASTNDTFAGTPVIADRLANLDQIVTRLRAAGKVVIVVPELPRGGAQAFSGVKLREHLRIAQFLRGLSDRPGVHVADPWPDLVDPLDAQAQPKAGMFYDGLHMAEPGAFQIGRAVATILATFLPEPSLLASSNADIWTADNPLGCLWTNPMLDGTAGVLGTGHTGQVANGVSTVASDAALAVAAAKVTGGTKVWQQLAVSGTSAAAVPYAQLSRTITTNYAAGDVLEATCEIEENAGSAGVYGPQLLLQANGTPVVTAVAGWAYPAPDYGFGSGLAWGGVMRTPRITVPPGTVSVVSTVVARGKPNVAMATTFRVARWAVRKVG